MKAHTTLIRFSLAALVVLAAAQAAPLDPSSLPSLGNTHGSLRFNSAGGIWILAGVAYLSLILLLARLVGFSNIDEQE